MSATGAESEAPYDGGTVQLREQGLLENQLSLYKRGNPLSASFSGGQELGQAASEGGVQNRTFGRAP